MDVLAGRKTGGVIEGSIHISGHPKRQDTFARVSGYCEQTDIHSPCLTIVESLLFSAWLRLPSDVDLETQRVKPDWWFLLKLLWCVININWYMIVYLCAGFCGWGDGTCWAYSTQWSFSWSTGCWWFINWTKEKINNCCWTCSEPIHSVHGRTYVRAGCKVCCHCHADSEEYCQYRAYNSLHNPSA